MNLVKKLFPSAFAEKIGGMKDYYLHFEKYKSPWGAQFNNQQLRTKIFDAIIKKGLVDFIVETGTFRGTTTDYFLTATGYPIYSVELDVRSFYFSKCRFRKSKRVTLFNDDSRSFLNYLVTQKALKSRNIFFYLDAHWNDDLPLVQELEIIMKNWENYIVMIDDFKVDNDPGYDYDIYNGQSLELTLLNPLKQYYYKAYFPINSTNETGAKRGSIILTGSEKIANELNLIAELIKA